MGPAVVRGVLSVLGRPVLLRALAVYVAVGLPSAIIFSPNGLRAVDVVRMMHHSFAVRATLWIGWLLLAAPATYAVFSAPGAITLRALRLPRARLAAALVACAALVQVPWAFLFARGSGPAAAIGAVLVAIAGVTATVAASRRAVFLLLFVPSLAVVLFDPHASVVVSMGAVLAPWSVLAAWRAAPEQRGFAWGLRVPRWTSFGPLSALVRLHLLRLLRASGSRVIMATASGVVGGLALLTLRSTPTERPLQRALGSTAIPWVLAAAIFAGPVLASERIVRPLLRTLRIRQVTILAAFLVAIGLPTTALAATAAVGASAFCSIASLPLVGTLVAWAAALTCVVGAWARVHDRTQKRDAVVFALGVVLVGGVATVSVMAW